jgi:hypothetical protein
MWSVGAHADVARFHADDCDELVIASLACDLCLRSASVAWTLDDGDSYDASVRCHCRRCEHEWPVYLTAQQALRLSLLGARTR